MSRGNRYIIFAVVGWLSLSAATQPEQHRPAADNDYTARQTHQAADTIATAISQAIKTPEHDGGCAKGDEVRQSDLCAQWQAADAAKDAARYALWSLIGTAIGTALLIWTLYETRQNSRRELRAYVDVKKVFLEGPLDRRARFKIMVVNSGQTPAYNVSIAGYAKIFNMAKTQPDWLEFIDQSVSLATISGNGDILSETTFAPPLRERDMLGLSERFAAIGVVGRITYQDVFGSERKTDFRYMMMPEYDASFAPMGDGNAAT